MNKEVRSELIESNANSRKTKYFLGGKAIIFFQRFHCLKQKKEKSRLRLAVSYSGFRTEVYRRFYIFACALRVDPHAGVENMLKN